MKVYERNYESKYAKIKRSRFWGIMHDGIQKFCTEYNGMMIQSYDPDNFKPLLVPFWLMQMKGGFFDAHEVEDSVFHSIRKWNGFENVVNADIPVYFKVSVVTKVENGEIHLNVLW